mmetsp:Transcript_22177/g.70842  ORF Transcript_22177/g.70842 Transcript_22177/m.70842 type:complete len:204 (+) Transcript_22177:205-816(+)
MTDTTTKLLPPVKWAQRKDTLFVTIDVPDVVKDSAVVDLKDDSLTFKGKSHDNEYELELEFWKEGEGIDAAADGSKYSIKPRNIQFHLVKKKEGFWPRLLENKQLQKTNVKVDFDKWVDSDDEDEGGFNTAGMDDLAGGMGGMGGMDMAQLQQMMAQMGGGGQLAAQMGGGEGGMPDLSSFTAGADDEGEEGDSDDEALPDLE